MTEPKTNRDVINAMSDEELAKQRKRIEVYRQKYEQLKAAVEETAKMTALDGEADQLSWGFEHEKVAQRQAKMAQPLPLDD